jgi:hypothetical protein
LTGFQNLSLSSGEKLMKMSIKNNQLIMLAVSVLVISSCATQAPVEPEAKPEAEVPVKPVEKPKPKYLQVAERDAERIGKKIWMNEGSGQIKNLTVWNRGENFASLGIGHFIWYPADQKESFKETFPELIAFLQAQGVEIPTWLQTTADAPWKSYSAFKRDEQSAKMKQLRSLLANTIPQQVQFIIKRLEQALPKMLESLPFEAQRVQVREQFYRVAQQPAGVYALIDYINFKGEGTSPRERYQGQGWGLLQVLENMRGLSSEGVMTEFAQSAEFILKRRIKNAPPTRNESRWLPGWKNRIKTYTVPL